MGNRAFKQDVARPTTDTRRDSAKERSRQFRYAFGRRYHNDANCAYFIPNDDDECDRLAMEHFLLRYCNHGSFSAPVEAKLLLGGATVLDSGCGAGTWVLNLASDYPASSFVGLDISAVYPSQIRPKNVLFVENNLLNGLPFPDCSFDYVHQRFLVAAFTKDQWRTTILPELLRVTKPGGWVELVESDVHLLNEGDTARSIADALTEVFSLRSMDPDIGQHLPTLLREFPDMHHVTEHDTEIPVGAWAGTIGGLALTDLSTLYGAIKPELSDAMGIDHAMFDSVLREFVKEADARRSEWKIRHVYAQKLDPSSTPSSFT